MKKSAIWFVMFVVVADGCGRESATNSPPPEKTPAASPRHEKTPAASLSKEKTSPASSPQEKALAAEKEISFDLGNGVNLVMILIRTGQFQMGSPVSEGDALVNENVQHLVRITKAFYLGKYPVTQEQWKAVMGSDPSRFKGAKNPVEAVYWGDCCAFIERLNAKYARGRGRFTLPTEAQWEYACRAGSTTRHFFGDDEATLGEYAWYTRNSEGKTHPVGEKRANAWGLFDMYGNVREWCQDWYDDDY